jgi:hypothetical protein
MALGQHTIAAFADHFSSQQPIVSHVMMQADVTDDRNIRRIVTVY